MSDGRNNALLTTQFILAGVAWGASFLFMKVALDGMSPGQIAWTRILLGAATLSVFVVLRRDVFPRRIRIWMHMAVLAITFCLGPFLLFAWAQQYITSGLASIYNATTPIMTAVMAWAVFRVERLRLMQIVGIVVGMLGVIVIIAPWQGLDLSQSLIAQGACLGATACYGFSLAYMRRFVPPGTMSPLMVCFLFVGIAAVLMLMLTPVVAVGPLRLTPWIVASILVLGCVGTGITYIWNQNVLEAWGPTRASTVTYITPVVGVLLGILILGEALHWNEPLGAVLVFLGILLAQNRLRVPGLRRASAVREPEAQLRP